MFMVNFEATTGKKCRWHAQLGNDIIHYPNRAKEDKKLLIYTSDYLKNDVEITGYPIVNMFVSSTEEDGAFYVYLEDVCENGRVIYLTEGLLRAEHRKIKEENKPYNTYAPFYSFLKEDRMPFQVGEIINLKFYLQPISVLIKKGHQIRLAIAGHDKDTFIRIPEKGNPIITVYRNKIYNSYIDLPIIKK